MLYSRYLIKAHRNIDNYIKHGLPNADLNAGSNYIVVFPNWMYLKR